jgi:hypothetical protein
VFFLIPHKREYFFGAYSHVISKPFGEATGRIDIGIQHFYGGMDLKISGKKIFFGFCTHTICDWILI